MRRIAIHPPLVAALMVLVGVAGESKAQVPAPVGVPVAEVPPPRPLGLRLRALGQEFADKVRYPFYAIPESFRPTPSRVALRPSYDGRTVAVPVEPVPVRPLFLSGYAGAARPVPRRPLVPTGHGIHHSQHHGPGSIAPHWYQPPH